MKSPQGFSLTELMIVVAIVAALSAIAIPSYNNYMRRAHFTEIIRATAPYKLGVELCFQHTGSLNDCNAGDEGIPHAISSGDHPGLIDTLSVNAGSIDVTPKNKKGLDASDTYLLTPSIHNHHLSWATSGGAVTKGYAR